MVKLIIFAILIVIVITAFNLDLSFLIEGFSVITSYIEDLPQIFNYVTNILTNLFNAPVLRILLLVGITFMLLKWLLGLVGDNDEQHRYKD